MEKIKGGQRDGGDLYVIPRKKWPWGSDLEVCADGDDMCGGFIIIRSRTDKEEQVDIPMAQVGDLIKALQELSKDE